MSSSDDGLYSFSAASTTHDVMTANLRDRLLQLSLADSADGLVGTLPRNLAGVDKLPSCLFILSARRAGGETAWRWGWPGMQQDERVDIDRLVSLTTTRNWRVGGRAARPHTRTLHYDQDDGHAAPWPTDWVPFVQRLCCHRRRRRRCVVMSPIYGIASSGRRRSTSLIDLLSSDGGRAKASLSHGAESQFTSLPTKTAISSCSETTNGAEPRETGRIKRFNDLHSFTNAQTCP